MAGDNDDSERADGVHRLVDMIVEEVSLVDRAANQRRFLIVKRRQKMADEGTPAPDDAPGDGGSGGGAATGGTEAMAALTEAVTALAELVTIDAAEKAFPPPKKPKGGGGGGGADDDDEEGGEEDDDEDEDEKAEAERRRKAAESVTALLNQVKAALARLQTAVTAPAQKRDAAPGGADPVMAKLDGIAGSISKLETQLKEQGDRIGKVEKNVGLPASRTPEGGGAGGDPGDEDDVSWPLDLNAPMDRASVDKSLSFHGDK
ncbi:MAG: hypothetical protein HS111_09840 [Kofleriaceae bacterium]|nr:hypothetical protein [Kofleriaceae bacterium]